MGGKEAGGADKGKGIPILRWKEVVVVEMRECRLGAVEVYVILVIEVVLDVGLAYVEELWDCCD